jgi:plastocyanin
MTTTTSRGRALAALAVLALALAAAACGGDDEPTVSQPGTTATPSAASSPTTAAAASGGATTTTVAPNTITIANFAFAGLDGARSGGTWRVTNSDSVPHTVTAVDGSFVWAVAAGQTATFDRALAPGRYPVKCDIHPAMTGTLVVS